MRIVSLQWALRIDLFPGKWIRMKLFPGQQSFFQMKMKVFFGQWVLSQVRVLAYSWVRIASLAIIDKSN